MKSTLLFLFFLSVLTYSSVAQNKLEQLKEAGVIWANKGEWHKADSVYSLALNAEEIDEHLELKGDILNLRYVALYYQSKYEDAVYNNVACIAVFKELDNQASLANAYFNQGLNYKNLGSYDLAIENYLEALQLFKQLNDESGIIDTYSTIGSSYRNYGDPEKGIEYHKKGLELAIQIQDTTSVSNLYHGLGLDYRKLEDYDQALICFQKVKQLDILTNSPLGIVHSQLGEVYLEMHMYDSSFIYLKSALNLRKLDGNRAGIATAHRQLGNYFLQTDNQDLADMYLDSAFIISSELGRDSEVLLILDLLVELDRKKYGSNVFENSDLRYDYYKKIKGLSTQKEIVLAEVKYKTAEIEGHLEREKSTNEILAFQNKILIIGIISVIIFILIIVVILDKLRKSKVETEEKNQRLAESKALIESLHQELSHRTKNYYQMFAGILKHDKKHIQEAETMRLVNNYIHRVEAMSQIQHYLLEQDNAGREVQLDRYLKEILLNIDLVLNQKTPLVAIEQDFHKTSLDYDRALKLGLVLNEMVSNAFEHAFKNNEAPKLSIQLSSRKNEVQLDIIDNGIGIKSPEEIMTKSKGIGLMQMILKSVESELVFIPEQKGVHVRVVLTKKRRP